MNQKMMRLAPPATQQQDTPIIPIDDGYDSDTQTVPNDQLPLPDRNDAELVPASVSLDVPIEDKGSFLIL